MTLLCMSHTVKGARGKVWFDSLNIKYSSKLSSEASPEAYLSHLTVLPKWQMRFSIFWVTNTPQEQHHWIILKHICHFVSQMILYLGPLLQCSGVNDSAEIFFKICICICTQRCHICTAESRTPLCTSQRCQWLLCARHSRVIDSAVTKIGDFLGKF
jgi:hypothetical protein